MKKLVVVTYNQHKYHEYQRLLKDEAFELEPLSVHFQGVLEETGNSFEANARQKLAQVRYRPNTYYIAEDSGLEIEALEGEPGVFSARYSASGKDKDNNLKVLKKMANVSDRRARFKAVIALREPSGTVTTFEGVCLGRIHTEMVGQEGFGYDPIFMPLPYLETFAQLGSNVKHQLSHRQKALKKMLQYLRGLQ